MSRLRRKSLFGQTILILPVELVVSHAIGAWIYAGAREQAVRAVDGLAAAQRVANLSRLVAADLRMPAGRVEARDHQPARSTTP